MKQTSWWDSTPDTWPGPWLKAKSGGQPYGGHKFACYEFGGQVQKAEGQLCHAFVMFLGREGQLRGQITMWGGRGAKRPAGNQGLNDSIFQRYTERQTGITGHPPHTPGTLRRPLDPSAPPHAAAGTEVNRVGSVPNGSRATAVGVEQGSNVERTTSAAPRPFFAWVRRGESPLPPSGECKGLGAEVPLRGCHRFQIFQIFKFWEIKLIFLIFLI